MANDDAMRPMGDQLELPGLGSRGEELMREARQWTADNPGAWSYMLANAERLSRRGYVSANYLVNMVRNELGVGVKNACAAAFARIICEQRPGLSDAFRRHSSITDGFCK
nr:hypothetical protein [uncultured Olsenella sp.]